MDNTDINQQPIKSAEEIAEDKKIEIALRPKKLTDFVGQNKIKNNLEIFLQAAKNRQEPIDHVLFYGPPGLGKTTLSHIIAEEMQANLKVTTGPAIEKSGDLAAILTNMQPGDILFIDEIHRLNKTVEEILYPAMEDFVLDIVIGKGPSARTIRLDLQKFTLVGATTRLGLLTGPFRDRFGVVHRLEYYTPNTLAEILTKASKKLGVKLNQNNAIELAKRSRGTPRIALKLLKRVRDYAQIKGNGEITDEIISKALSLLNIDLVGLDDQDKKMLQMIIVHHNGGPVGLSTLAASLNEDPGTVEEVIEPYLIQIGFLKRTSQ
ncbi:Holliday junction DNA helicase RuvB, partial [Candidatus Falkowbacteria bacterium RIFOXYA2_FULL_35_8]